MSDGEFDLSDAEEYFLPLEHSSAPLALQNSLMPSTRELEELLDEIESENTGRAAQVCLALPELVERILLHVPPLDVYCLERVNTLFRDLISRSVPVRRHMYFMPEKYFVRPELNALLLPRVSGDKRLARAINPFQFTLFGHKKGFGVTVRLSYEWTRTSSDSNALAFPLIESQPERKHDSWRHILISDSDEPLNIELGGDVVGYWEWQFNSRIRGQATLGDLVDKARHLTNEAIKTREETEMFPYRIYSDTYRYLDGDFTEVEDDSDDLDFDEASLNGDLTELEENFVDSFTAEAH